MNKLYLIVLSTKYDREKIIEYLMNKGSITHWFFSMPYSFFVRTNLSARALQNSIFAQFGQDKIFIIHVKSGTDISGVVPDDQVFNFNNL